jgi:hypothetical protein
LAYSDSLYTIIEDKLAIFHKAIDNSMTDDYPHLLEWQAWAAFVEGRGSDMECYLDRYFKMLPEIIRKWPASAQTAIVMRNLDYRISMEE